jgi:biotin carboxylase
MSRTLWVVGAGEEAVPGIRRAKDMGLHVVASDMNPAAPGFAEADDQVVCDTYDVWATVRMASAYARTRRPLHGVIAMCADVPLTVSAIAADLGLHGLPLHVAQLGQDKAMMKRRLQAHSVPTAAGAEVAGPKAIVRFMMERGCDVAVKPVDSRGARGVSHVRTPNDAEAAYKLAVRESKSGRVLFEEWLPGQQLSVEGALLADGQFLAPGFLDRNYSRLKEFAPHVIEDGAQGPSSLPAAERAAILTTFEAAARAVVGSVPCTVKGDLVYATDGRGPMVIELALRLSGGYMSTELVPRMTGVDLVGIAVRLALRDQVEAAELRPTRDRGVAIRYRIPSNCSSHPERLGHAIAEGATAHEAVRLAEGMVRDGLLA